MAYPKRVTIKERTRNFATKTRQKSWKHTEYEMDHLLSLCNRRPQVIALRAVRDRGDYMRRLGIIQLTKNMSTVATIIRISGGVADASIEFCLSQAHTEKNHGLPI